MSGPAYQGPGGTPERGRLEAHGLPVEHVALAALFVAVVVAIVASPIDELAVGAWIAQRQGGRRGLD